MGAATTALDVKSLTKVFHERGNKSVKAVDSISFQVNQGEVLGLLGPNGAGKTTTIKCILGLMPVSYTHLDVYKRQV